jgi:AcrR family transcriptional regulator
MYRAGMARPKAFAEPAALQAALAVFWKQGYEATSTADLIAAMGIGRQSLYDTFGDKHQLYLRALRSFQADTAAGLRQRLAAAADPLAALIDYLRSVAQARASERMKGCMVVNALAERSPHDPQVMAIGIDHLAAIHTAFEDALRRAQAMGRIPPGRDLRARARLASVTMFGLAVQGKNGVDSATLNEAIDVLAQSLVA